MRYMHLKLIRRVADQVGGIDLSHCDIGEILVVSPRSASTLIAQGYAAEIHGTAFPVPSNPSTPRKFNWSLRSVER